MKLILALAFLLGTAQAQTCSVSSPCVKLTWTNSSMSATVVSSPGGIQTSGPGTAEVWACIGNGSCTVALMPPAGSVTPPSGSAWSLAGTVAQTSSAGTATAPVIYGTLMNYAVRNLWTGGTTQGPFSAIATFQSPQAPQGSPLSPSAPTVVLVTTGSTSF